MQFTAVWLFALQAWTRNINDGAVNQAVDYIMAQPDGMDHARCLLEGILTCYSPLDQRRELVEERGKRCRFKYGLRDPRGGCFVGHVHASLAIGRLISVYYLPDVFICCAGSFSCLAFKLKPSGRRGISRAVEAVRLLPLLWSSITVPVFVNKDCRTIRSYPKTLTPTHSFESPCVHVFAPTHGLHVPLTAIGKAPSPPETASADT